MKNWIIYLSILITAGIASCSKNSDFLYDSQDSIYLNYPDTTSRKISYSFAYTPNIAEDTVWIPVKISGEIIPHDRSFKLAVVDSVTTAEPGAHFEPLQDSYTMPADSGTISVPVVIYNKDPALDSSTVTLGIALVPTADFKIAFPQLDYARLSFSNRLEQPAWWIYWMSSLGPYSRVKHQLFLIATGTNDMPDMSQPDAYLLVPEALYHISQYTALIGDPFGWVEKHPEYALTENEDGSYSFYLVDTPQKIIILMKDEASGSFHFIDENGQII